MEKRLATNDMLEMQKLKWDFVLLMSEQSILISNWLFSYNHSKFFEHVEIKLCQNVCNVDLLINALQPVLEARNHRRKTFYVFPNARHFYYVFNVVWLLKEHIAIDKILKRKQNNSNNYIIFCLAYTYTDYFTSK